MSQLLILNSLFGSHGLPVCEVEYKFDMKRRFRFDYAWPAHKIAIEVEGGVWRKGGGAHSRPANIMRDIEKYNLATCSGWRIIRVTPQTLLTNQTAEMVRQVFNLKN